MASKSNDAPRLVVIEGKDKGKVLPLQNGTTIIGRSKGEFLVQDARVSRSHVAIHYDEKQQRLSFTDLKSLNGSFVNDATKTSGVLKDGDQLKIGDTVFDCQLEANADRRGATNEPSSLADFEQEFDESATREQERPKSKKKKKKEKKKKKKKPKGEVVSLRQRYLKASPRARRMALCLLLLAFTGLYSVLETGPTRDDLLREIAAAKTLKEEGKYNEALHKLGQEESKWGDKLSEGYLLLGDIHAEMSHFDKAIVAYLKVRGFEGVTPMVHIKLLRSYLRSGLMNEAKEELRALDVVVKDSVRDLVTKIKEENRKAKEILDERPHIRELLVETGKLFVDFEQLNWSQDKALLLTKGLQQQIAPDSPVGYLLEAQILARENRTAEARRILDKAKKLSNDPWSIGKVALLLFDLKDFEASTVALAEWISITPKSEEANFLQNKIFAYRALDKAQRAESSGNLEKERLRQLMNQSLRYLELADRYRSTDPWVIENIAHAKLKLLDYSGASAIVNRWVRLYPSSTKALLIMSYLKLNERAPDQALPFIERILTISKRSPKEPFFAEAMFLKSQVLVFKNEHDEAARLAKQACDLGYQEACQSPLLRGERSPSDKKK